MALVTVQRSPSPSNSPELSESGEDEVDQGKNVLRQRRSSKLAFNRIKKLLNTVRFITKLRPHFSESYFAVKGAALILPRSEIALKPVPKSHGKGDIQNHLQSMFYLLRPEDTIKVAIKLESKYPGRNRYMAVVSTIGRQDTEESVILGIDCNDNVKIGLVLPIWANTKLRLDGDGGFSVFCTGKQYIFKPVSVQAMWSGIQALDKVVQLAVVNNYITGRDGLSHTWIGYYESKIPIDESVITYLNEWHLMEDVHGQKGYRYAELKSDDEELEALKKRISNGLKNVMMRVDLDEATSRSLREGVEEEIGLSLQKFKGFLDEEMIRILGQMDAPSLIFDYLYLGSEWNASNLEELFHNKVGHILNVSREIDNFFSGMFKYMNVREYDRPSSDLMKYWEETCAFISKARTQGSKVLVHCKMGISRSASTVIAYAMKEYGWSLQKALEYVKEKRSIINPNEGFLKQLETYEGILNASKKRHIFRAHSENVLNHEYKSGEHTEKPQFLVDDSLYPPDPGVESHDMTEGEVLLRQALGKTALGKEGEMYCNIESDIEISSRSADSTENSLPDVPSPKPASDPGISKHTGQAGIYIFPDRASVGVASLSNEVAGRKSDPLNFQIGPSGSESEDEQTDEEEMDFENDSDDEERFFQPVRQSIDLSRLTQSEDTKEAKRVIRRLSQPIDLIDKRLHVWRPESMLVEQTVSDDSLQLSDEQNVLGRYDYSQMETECDTPLVSSNVDAGINSNIPLLSQNSNPIIVVESPCQVEASNTQTQPYLSDSQVYVEDIDNNKVLSNIETSQCYSDNPVSETTKKKVEMGVRHHYIKEKIPWRVGTVKKKTQNLEEKIECVKVNEHKRSDSSGSVNINTDLMITPADSNVLTYQTENVLPYDGAVCDSLTAVQQETISSHERQSMLVDEINTSPLINSAIEIVTNSESTVQDGVLHNQNNSPLQPFTTDNTSQSQMETEVFPDEEVNLKRPTSVYELEDIPLPAGIVKETTKAIEQRERLSSNNIEEIFKSKPVHRSSSLKSVRVTPKVKRNSERRKTCMAILSPTNLISRDEVMRGSKSDGENDLEDIDTQSEHGTENHIVHRCGTEEVPLEPGIVRKYKEGFESLDMKAKERTASESKTLPFFIGDGSEDVFSTTEATIFDSSDTRNISETLLTEKLKIQDLESSSSIPSGHLPTTVPDFHVADNRAKVSSNVFDKLEFKLGVTPQCSTRTVTSTQQKESPVKEQITVTSTLPISPVDDVRKSHDTEIDYSPDTNRASDTVDVETDNKKTVSEMIHEREAAVMASSTENQPVIRPRRGESESSCFDPKTLHLIREIGSALLNSPPQQKKDTTVDHSNVVKYIVRNIESKTEKEEKHLGKEIVIIDKEPSEKKSDSLPSSPVIHSENKIKCVPSILDSQKHSKDCDQFVHISRCSEPVAQSVANVPKSVGKEIILDKSVKCTEDELPSPSSDCDSANLTSKYDRVKEMVGKFEPKNSAEAPSSSDTSSENLLRTNPVTAVRPKSADNIFRNTQKPPFQMAKNTEAKRAALIRHHHLSASVQESGSDFPQFSLDHRKVRKLHGKSHPLSKLERGDYHTKRNSNPFYNTM